jgi:hypothetical protein
VLHAIAHEVAGVAVVHADGTAHDQGALGPAQPLEDVGVEIDDLGDGFELADGHLVDRRLLEDRQATGRTGAVIHDAHLGEEEITEWKCRMQNRECKMTFAC